MLPTNLRSGSERASGEKNVEYCGNGVLDEPPDDPGAEMAREARVWRTPIDRFKTGVTQAALLSAIYTA
ncbi:hypothetical protein FRC07_010564 [Ceratobasidium sp. 392]|nr:hypothetical protein FRC07_010564 [Ceratobasidium sp. 392]